MFAHTVLREDAAHGIFVLRWKVLGDIIDQTETLGEAVEVYSKTRAVEAKKLVTISRELDRPGEISVCVCLRG